VVLGSNFKGRFISAQQNEDRQDESPSQSTYLSPLTTDQELGGLFRLNA